MGATQTKQTKPRTSYPIRSYGFGQTKNVVQKQKQAKKLGIKLTYTRNGKRYRKTAKQLDAAISKHKRSTSFGKKKRKTRKTRDACQRRTKSADCKSARTILNRKACKWTRRKGCSYRAGLKRKSSTSKKTRKSIRTMAALSQVARLRRAKQDKRNREISRRDALAGKQNPPVYGTGFGRRTGFGNRPLIRHY